MAGFTDAGVDGLEASTAGFFAPLARGATLGAGTASVATRAPFGLDVVARFATGGVFGAGTDAVTADDPADPAPGFGAPVALPAVVTALSRGLSGTEGSLCDSIFTSRVGACLVTVGFCSSLLGITSTS